MLTDGGGGGTSFEEDLDSVAPRSAPAGASEPPPPGGVGLGIRPVRLFGEAGPAPGVGGGGSGAGVGDAALDFKLAAAVLRTGGGGGASGSDEDEVSEVESFILDQEDLDNPVLKTTSEIFLSSTAEGADLRTVDPETQARLEALLEAAGIGKLSTADGKAFADPEVLRRLTSSVSCALDEAAAALTRMKAENGHNAGQIDTRSLAEACSDGDVNAVRKLLDEGRSVNEHTEEGESLLCLACSAVYYELAQVLLAMHADVEDRGTKGDITPLMAASSGGYLDIVKLLLLHDANVNSQSATGNTALTYACAGGFVDIVKVLLNEGANIEDHNENGHTPLMEAASAGHVEVARVLLDHGAGINTHSNEFKESALTLACYKGHLDMVRFLLDAGADQEHKTDEMHTALMEACMDGHVEVARLLLDSGAQVNMPADSFESPLTLAACGGHVELAALLIERGANLEEVNDEGYTPLMEAAREGHEEMVALLLAQGANINAQTEETQETALTLACCGGFSEVADFLIKAGADIELGCSTPLMEASQEGHLELVKYLLAAGANVHATTATGDTALTYACENGHTDVADVLLQAGADLEHESEGGRTPLMKAARAGHLCTVQFLISKGANVNRATANNDHTVVSLACAGGHLAVVELLLAHGADPTHRLKDGSTMLIEAAKGGHTNVVSYLLDYPNNVLSVPTTDVSILTPPSQDQSQVPRVPMHTLAMVVPPQEPDRSSQENSPALLGVQKAVSSRVPTGSNSSSQTTECLTPEPCSQSPSNVASQSLPPVYPSVDIDAHTESNHDTALTLACAGGHEELVSVLIARDAKIEHRDKKGFTPLILAATAGHVGVVEILLDKGGDIEAQSERTKDTPLSLACSGGRQEVVDLLLARGANKEHRNVSDYTPLSLAASGGYVNIIKILLNAGAEINSRTGSKLGISPLMLAAMNGHVPAVKLLLDMGSDINAQIETNRNTALTLACFQGRAEVVSLLLDRKANVEHRAKTGLTPLMEAASGGYAEVGRVLLDKGADVNAPPVPSSRDTALTIAADKGHYKFCELLISRGAHIDVHNKKGNTPLWLASNGGHFDVVQLLVQAGADVDAADNRKITPLMSAFRKGHVKVVQYLVKEVNQFPSDIECMRYIATITDKELLKKCHQCVETIVKAKDQQAAEANKNASILLKELDLEKSREESRKQALAAKREKRKEKRKKKKEEQKRKQEEDEENKPKENSELPEDEDEEENDEDVEQEVPIEPPSATTTTTIGISATSATFTNAFGKKRANVVTTPSTNRKNKKNKTKETPPTAPLILPEQHISLTQQKADKNKINGEPRGGGAGGNSDSDNLDSTDCNSESSSGGKSQELNFSMDVNSSGDRRYPSLLLHSQEEKISTAASKTQTRPEGEVNSSSLSTSYKSVSLPLNSPNIKLNLTSPKRGQKREEGWKEVVRRSKKLSVPASVVSRIMGRGGCNITAIQDVTGAHIDVDKQKDKNGERMITIRGGTESTRYAVQLINALIQDPAKELEDLIPKNHIRTPTSTKSIHANFSSGVGTTAASSKNAFPLGAPTLVTSQATTLSTFQATNKLNKNVPTNVRSSFPVSLPLAYPHPHFALLAAQTMQQIRHPRLPMAQFGGTFSPSPNTWGPFPVRPVNPGNANSSPKHNSTSRLPNQNGTVLPSESAGLATASCPITVPSVVAASQQLCVTNTRTPSSVRKQLFACVPKTSPPATVISSVTSTCSSLPSVSSAPITSGQVPTPFLSTSAPQAQLSSQKMESFSAMPPPKEKVSTQDQPTANLCTPSSTANSCNSSASNTPGAPETHPSNSPTPNNTQDEAQSSSVSELSPMSMPFASNSEPTPLTLASPRLVAADNQDNNNLPQLAVPAPRVSHRMQPRGSFYSVVPNATLHQDPQSIFVTNPVPLTPPQGPPAAVQLSSAMNIMNGSQMHINPANKSLPPTFGPATLFNHFSSLFDSSQVPANQGWGDAPLSSRVAADASFTVQSAFLNNSVLGHLENVHPDNSKAPGFRTPSQRVSTSPAGLPSIDPSGSSPSSSSAPLTSFSGIPGTRVFLQGPAPVGTPSFNRQHFSPHPWTSASNSCDSPIPSVSSGSSSPLSAASAPPALGQPKGGNASQDRKIPPPIGTERLARIRQGGSVAQAPVGTSFVAPVGHSGIWSFGVNAMSEGLSGWSQSVIGNHPMHQQLSDPSTFSQHQPMERDDSGMVAPSNIFHQPMASSFVDFSKGLPISMYGGTIIPSHPQLADVPGGPLFNGLHNPDPAWNPMIKVIQNSTECTDAQQASLLPSVPALKGEIPPPQLTRVKKRVGQPIVPSPNQRHQDHLRQKVPPGVQELTHCPDTPLLPPSDSRGHNSSNSPILQAGGAEGTEGDRGRDTR
ncbi:PREDICTED: ankyrin repeat and KH domain-containing protein 1 isoform X9 [Myotis davidii]|uniref:ankyrin repeat and KH domain-containing protein 1 isoform X9 n=1 Tax=Myotis davidii TaxID=225400 RepID=UPI000766FCC5|nr:PREDICTED: ankyrin repeat and KH domain-containing protein 1 isoform X9 [Myotis davidii]